MQSKLQPSTGLYVMVLLVLSAIDVTSMPGYAQEAPPDNDAQQLQKLLIEYRDTMHSEVVYLTELYESGGGIPGPIGRSGQILEELIRAKERLVDAELELVQTKAERIKLLEKAVVLAKTLEDAIKNEQEVGNAAPLSATSATAGRLRAEIRLAKARMEPGPSAAPAVQQRVLSPPRCARTRSRLR